MKTVRTTTVVAFPPGTVAQVSNENADRWAAEGWVSVVGETDEPVLLNLPEGVSEEDALRALDRLAKKAAKEAEG